MNGRVLVVAAIVAAACFVLAASPLQADADDPVPPQQLYPDADAIISESSDGGVLITLRDADSETGYTERTQRAGSAVRLASLSSLDGSYSVVMAGGNVGDLTLVTVDTYDEGRGTVDVSFEQVSGTVGRLYAVTVSSVISRSLPNDYSSPYAPIGAISVTVSGRIAEVCPTTDLIGVSSVSVSVLGGTVDRLYPTGEDGVYGTVSVTILDGTVGYMSNQSAVAGSLSYRLIRGSVEYLCLGADVESRNSLDRADKWTFYVDGDADIGIESGMEVGRAIIGAGILDRPSLLCNSQEPSAPGVSRSVSIVSDGTALVADRAFVVYDQVNGAATGDAYRFQTYTIGSTPASSAVRSYYYYNYQQQDVYGDDGIWPSIDGACIGTGTIAYLQTDVVVRYGTALEVSPGATAAITGDVVLYGSMVNSGYVDNGGLIEERESGAYTGSDPDGSGHLVQTIYTSAGSDRLDLMTVTRTAVAIRGYGGPASFGAAMVIIDRIDCTVLVSASDGLVTGDPVVVSVEEAVPYGGWSYAWRVHVSALDSVSGAVPVVVMTVPDTADDGYDAQVLGPSGDLETIRSSGSSGTTFTVDGNGLYQFRSYKEVEPEPDEPVIEEDSSFLKNMAIAAAIVVIAAIVVYLLLRRPRGRGPS